MFWEKSMTAVETALNWFAKLLFLMLLFWFFIPVCVGTIEQILCGEPVKIAALVGPALSTPFLLWHRLGFLLTECFSCDFSGNTGDIIVIIFVILLWCIHIGCFVLTILCWIKPKPVYWLPLAVILALGSIHMAEIFAIMCGV